MSFLVRREKLKLRICSSTGRSLATGIDSRFSSSFWVSNRCLCKRSESACDLDSVKEETQKVIRRRSESAYIRQVHDNVIMHTSIHVYICTSLVMYVRSRRLPMLMTSSLHARRAVWHVQKIHRKRCKIFVHFSSTPISILNLTISSESQ